MNEDRSDTTEGSPDGEPPDTAVVAAAAAVDLVVDDAASIETAAPQPANVLRLPGSVAEIDASPEGPEIGAFFDVDGTLVAGYTASIHMRERLRSVSVTGSGARSSRTCSRSPPRR